MKHAEIWLAAIVMLAAPMVVSAEGDGADENATWGLCQAQENSEQGNNASNGTVQSTPPFENLSEEDCENAEPPWAGTPGADHAPEDPGRPENPGGDHPGEDENPGGDQQPDDNPDQDDNPGNDQGR